MRLIVNGRVSNQTVDGRCAKICYESAAKARKVVKKFTRAGKAVYLCLHCNAWHTTSQRPFR